MSDDIQDNKASNYTKNSLTLIGTVSLGTGVMIGAGIFSLTGQMAEMAGSLFPFAFLAAALVVSFSAYSYVKMASTYPSAGGIGMFLHRAYGDSVTTAFHALLMYCSMVIAQSFLARTFGAYAAQLFDIPDNSILITIMAVMLIFVAFAINLSGNRLIGSVASFLGFVKVAGIALFAVAGIWLASDFNFLSGSANEINSVSIEQFLAATGLGILAFKGFTTITNSGAEVIDPHHNIGRAIIISIALCIVIYVLVGFAVASNLSLVEIIQTKNYSLAAASRPILGDYGVWFTAILAMVATAGGIIASIFAVSRMLTMLTEMKLIPHSHFGMPGSIQKHALVYTIVIALILTTFFNLTRIAALGIIFYLIMDIAIHYGVLRHLRHELKANVIVLLIAILLDLIILLAFIMVKIQSDVLVIYVAFFIMLCIFVMEKLFLKKGKITKKHDHH